MKSAIPLLLLFAGLAGAQWLPDVEQQQLRSLIPAGVPIGTHAKFYRLPQLYQSIYFLNSHPQRDILPVVNDEHPWRVSGGMFAAARSDWRNATALELPAGASIEYWAELTNAGAPGPVPKIRWRFPHGTKAYDVLIRVRPGQPEAVFEVRVHEKLAEGWDDGETFRPAVNVDNAEKRSHFGEFVNFVDLSGNSHRIVTRYAPNWFDVVEIAAATPFVSRRALAHDGGNLIPRHYVGAGTSCNTCHARVGERTGYGTGRRGDDGRFSWHPFWLAGPGDTATRIDARWPIKLRQ